MHWIPAGFLAEMDKLILKCIEKYKRPRRAKTVLRKNKGGGLMLSDFKTYYTAIVTKLCSAARRIDI